MDVGQARSEYLSFKCCSKALRTFVENCTCLFEECVRVNNISWTWVHSIYETNDKSLFKSKRINAEIIFLFLFFCYLMLLIIIPVLRSHACFWALSTWFIGFLKACVTRLEAWMCWLLNLTYSSLFIFVVSAFTVDCSKAYQLWWLWEWVWSAWLLCGCHLTAITRK